MNKKIFILVGCIVAFNLSAGDLDRAFRHLTAGEYDKAVEYLREELRDDPTNTAAHYGMARIYAAHDCKCYQADTAMYYINKAMATIPMNPDDRQTKRFAKLGVRDFTVQSLLHDINMEAFVVAQQANTFDSYERFISQSKFDSLIRVATTLRDELKYAELKHNQNLQSIRAWLNLNPQSAKYQEANTLYEKLLYDSISQPKTAAAYRAYLDQYPTGTYAKAAKAGFEQRIYEQYLAYHAIDSFVMFERVYPDNPYLSNIQDTLYAMATHDGRPEDYNFFIKNYSTNRNVFNAWNRLYEIYTANGVDSDYVFFQRIYSNYPFRERLEQDLKLSKLALAPFKQGEKYGYINTLTQEMVIPPTFFEAYPFYGGLAAVALQPCEDSCRYSYIDKTGKPIIKGNFAYPGDFIAGRAIVATQYCEGIPCHYGIINRKGDWIVPAIYDEIENQQEGVHLAKKNGDYGFIDPTGKTMIPFKFQDGSSYSEGLAAMKRGVTWMYIDHQGAQAFIQLYSTSFPFSSGLAVASPDDSLYGYIDKAGNWVIEPKFDFAEGFTGDTAIVTVKESNKKSRDFGLSYRYKIDRTGKLCYKLLNPDAPVAKGKAIRRRKR